METVQYMATTSQRSHPRKVYGSQRTSMIYGQDSFVKSSRCRHQMVRGSSSCPCRQSRPQCHPSSARSAGLRPLLQTFSRPCSQAPICKKATVDKGVNHQNRIQHPRQSRPGCEQQSNSRTSPGFLTDDAKCSPDAWALGLWQGPSKIALEDRRRRRNHGLVPREGPAIEEQVERIKGGDRCVWWIRDRQRNRNSVPLSSRRGRR